VNVELVCLDMAGTTVRDDGTVLVAFAAAISEVGLVPDTAPWHEAIQIVNQTMGQSKIEVFRRVVGDEAAAHRANDAFEHAYLEQVARGAVSAMPAAVELLSKLRKRGIRVCLTTGFSPTTREAIIGVLGWDQLVDLALSPADAGRGRPWPDLILTAMLRLQIGSVGSVVVVGDTPSDVECGLRAGAGLVVGVTSGSGRKDELTRAGAHLVVAGIGSLTDAILTSGATGVSASATA
jgi:phosphonatase-like hydrolase